MSDPNVAAIWASASRSSDDLDRVATRQDKRDEGVAAHGLALAAGWTVLLVRKD